MCIDRNITSVQPKTRQAGAIDVARQDDQYTASGATAEYESTRTMYTASGATAECQPIRTIYMA